jgi:hypothetical protein
MEHLQNDDAMTAFHSFRPALAYPGQFDNDKQLIDALEVFEKIGFQVVGSEFAEFISAARKNINDVQRLYDLGFQLIEIKLTDVAATILSRANQLLPGEEGLLCELVTALECEGQHMEACKMIKQQPALLNKSFMLQYLLAFNSVAMGNLDEPKRLLPNLQKFDKPDYQFMANSIAGMMARADTIKSVAKLDHQDLRGWHFVLNGSILTHLSPYGFDEGMNGRYCFFQDSSSMIREGIARLQTVVKAMKVELPCVFFVPDRASEILGLACAQILGVDAKVWTANCLAPGLIVTYDIGDVDFEVVKSLRDRRAGQLFWSHSACWTESPGYAPDVVTYLYQVNRSPWDSPLRADATGEVAESVPDTRPPELIAGEIASESTSSDRLTDLQELSEFVTAASRTPEQYGLLPSSGIRRRFRGESPVHSNRF